MAEGDFYGAAHVSRRGETLFEGARGLADRAHGVANTVETQFATASVTKAFTALGIMGLVADGRLSFDAPIRDVLGDQPELALVDPAVTVGQLLAHTSGIGDYLDEELIEDLDDYVLAVPVHRLTRPSDYLAVLGGHPTKFPPGTRFEYCNGGFLLLSLVIEAASGESYYDVVARRVLKPAGMASTAFLRADELPGSAAIGYLPARGWRSNAFHLPVRGAGDGGAYTTVGDLARFWSALFAGRILPAPVVAEMVRPRNDAPSESLRHGLGFWVHAEREMAMLRGGDPGISCGTAHDPASGVTYAVLSNTSDGAWPLLRALNAWVLELKP